MPNETRISLRSAAKVNDTSPQKIPNNFNEIILKLEQEVLRLSTQATVKDTLVNEMAEKIKKMDERILQLEHDQMRNQSYFIIHERTTTLLQQRIDQLEQYTRRYSVIVKGIEVNRNENQETLKNHVTDLIQSCNSLTKLEDVDKFHRNGPVYKENNQDLIIRFKSHFAKEQFYNSRKNIPPNKKIKIQPSLSPERKNLLDDAREQVNVYKDETSSSEETSQNLPHFVLPDVHGNLLVKMKKKTPRGLFLKFNSLQELYAIVNKYNTSDANKAFEEKMKNVDGSLTTESVTTPEERTPEVN